ncbi:MAG: L-seryl-tRNA(Sec) selenium transferase [Deltaproteobacteria bacterium]|jgi:L-seryl-tRNA(Ser) seleniumtransferase|nr:L-seryl-tRNA(Sec) selenium transferase [Deltaproteobacteria bacterium]MBT4268262.1 L-seryl-tRNA(Sec) selenium transferase [Deltaproteobacteria bacterium]MBT4637775.1 L-seryl-tRNA(Sec) selenium transferase [Deltaproteobacteria bacterium]MBT6501179.1 L-seryl-tRNA(Sec) selenium transferase [Deltaproteobacteria bacterium]MBT6611372.1 L-seryl-tRNA(Sec) selenium transferase [Deltaproteobacteria bacterium]
MQNTQYIFSKIPSVQEIDAYLSGQNMKYGKEVRNQIQTLLVEVRQEIQWLSAESTTRDSILLWIKNRLEQNRQELIPLINGTGAIIHTNLGRSVFSREVFQEAIEIATSYTNLEFSLETGKRGARLSNVGNLLKTLTGAEEAVIVNNNAAAVLLTLIAFAQGKEVIISRGEQVEIGGSFRIPEVISVSGAILKEVGSTNRTHLADYENAIGDQTAMLLKVHTSNYQILGFTQAVPTPDLAQLAQKTGKILVEDLGSGALTPFTHPQLNTEPLVPQILKDGVDIVTFSGDKLLGGPQAGIIVGKKKYLDKIRQHPLYRALRCDKLTMLLLEKTLVAYSKNEQQSLVPTQKMLNESENQVKTRAEMILSDLDPNTFQLVKCESTPGGGSLPGRAIASWGVLINKAGVTENQLLDQLRASNPPVIGRIHEGAVILDCRTVLPHQIDLLKNVLQTLEHN